MRQWERGGLGPLRSIEYCCFVHSDDEPETARHQVVILIVVKPRVLAPLL